MLRALNVLLQNICTYDLHQYSHYFKRILIHPYIKLYHLLPKHIQCLRLLFKLVTNKKSYYFNNTIKCSSPLGRTAIKMSTAE